MKFEKVIVNNTDEILTNHGKYENKPRRMWMKYKKNHRKVG